MANFQTAKQRAESLSPGKVSDVLFAIIRRRERELAAYNVATIKEDSEGTKGQPIGFYSHATEQITRGRKAQGQPFDLFETGEFLGGLFARVDKDSIFFDTTDPKKSKVLENTLTDDLFGLQDDDLQKVLRERVTPFFIDEIRRLL